ncbi:hypothetical protein JL37_20720 [Achromobacter sp. RTa]|uniref:DUF2235 domain-containing protein n=1 Tax=Achromobacter sp. RTa TaxID=1532557 RepID=UPI00050EC02F|nr:DUF2235 domain-containing protein [Achromobacter sp. RTa]KGD90377.1 hypothetical protein JL37_20720 [Achromobacter sp. RTa]
MADKAPDGMPQVNRTPASVLKKMAENEAAYPKQDCNECGAVIRIGFFFDGFGRHRDLDSEHPTFYSNICRLWEAHYAHEDEDRPVNQYWFRFYYSGLGTDLNEDAKIDDFIYGATVAGKKVLSETVKNAKNAAKNITRIDEIPEHDALKRAQGAVQKAIKEGSFQPMVKAYKDVVKDVKTLPDKVVRVWNAWDPERMANRAKGTVRGFWRGFKNNPLKVAWTAGKEIVKSTALEGVPIIRDNETVAYLMGTGVDKRVDAALRQLKAAHEAVSADMNNVRRIEISVFGGDRGGVMARQFVNDVVKKYRRRHDKDLVFPGQNGARGAEIQIRFLGLLDSVSSIMDESTFLGFLPFTDLIKQTHKDRTLTVPGAVAKCMHFAAAHELRANQRLDSLEKTRGEQYLYPGSSGDVMGVSPEGSLGSRTELSRVPLRDMLNAALSNGVAIYSMEQLRSKRPQTYDKFSLGSQIKDGGQSYYITDLVEAYRGVVKYQPGVDFMPHMEVFLRWLAVRYQDPVFKAELSDPAEKWIQDRDFFTPEQAYNEEYRRVLAMSEEDRKKPENTARLDELRALREERWNRAVASRGELPPQRFKPLWQRLEEEYRELEKAERQDAETERRKEEYRRAFPSHASVMDSWELDIDNPRHPQNLRNEMIKRHGGELTEADKPKDPFADMKAKRATQRRLLEVWREASTGTNPLPPKVMALFDFLVHDAMLSSWPDHLLASTSMYFRVRDKDIFGKTDFKSEEAKLKTDTDSAARIDQLNAKLDTFVPVRP